MTDNRNAYLRVGATAAAVFVALLLAGVARGEGPVEPGVPATATPAPYDPGYRDGPSRRDPRGGGAPMPDFGGGDAVPDPGGTEPAPDTTDGATT